MASDEKDKITVSAAALDQEARSWARNLEAKERSRTGVNASDARKAVARRSGLLPGTLENIGRGRIKGIRASALEALRGLYLRELTNEIARLEHERELVVARNTFLDHEQAQTVEACISEAKEILKEAAK